MAQVRMTPTNFLIMSGRFPHKCLPRVFANSSDAIDTHNLESSALGPLPSTDVLLHCGDLTQVGGVSSFRKALKLLGSIEAELKLVIPGNHDLELDREFWRSQRDEDGEPEDPQDHEQAIATMTGSLAREAEVTMLNEGVHCFQLRSGASFNIYVSPYTPAFCDWAFTYEHDNDRFNSQCDVAEGVTSIATNPIPSDVGLDIVMTHGPPKDVLDGCPRGNVGCRNLLTAIQRVKPRLHCFGHIHEGYGAKMLNWEHDEDKSDVLSESLPNAHPGPVRNTYPQVMATKPSRGIQTLAVNAAIMNGQNQPTNRPWLLSLELANGDCSRSRKNVADRANLRD